MFFKTIIFLTMLCVVKGSVITINVYDDHENKASHTLRDCNYQACDQLCRRLGFPGGACVGDRCKCDNFREIDDDGNKASHTLRDCNYQACDQLCRRLGFPGGACVGDRCKCDNFREIEDDENEESDSFRGCNTQACDQLCRWLEFPGGTCIGDQCNCNDSREIKEHHNPVVDEKRQTRSKSNYLMSFKDDLPVISMPGACNPVGCNDMCHRLNYIGGMCRGGNCECY